MPCSMVFPNSGRLSTRLERASFRERGAGIAARSAQMNPTPRGGRPGDRHTNLPKTPATAYPPIFFAVRTAARPTPPGLLLPEQPVPVSGLSQDVCPDRPAVTLDWPVVESNQRQRRLVPTGSFMVNEGSMQEKNQNEDIACRLPAIWSPSGIACDRHLPKLGSGRATIFTTRTQPQGVRSRGPCTAAFGPAEAARSRSANAQPSGAIIPPLAQYSQSGGHVQIHFAERYAERSSVGGWCGDSALSSDIAFRGRLEPIRAPRMAQSLRWRLWASPLFKDAHNLSLPLSAPHSFCKPCG
jgi:hypothetical protein